MNQLSTRLNLTKLIRIAIGSGLAILIADSLSLQYSASAGIITLLTIQNTKKETIEISFRRLLSFALALALAYPLFHLIGYHPFVFGLFLFLFVGLSEVLSLSDGISMNAVLTTHFLIEQTMSFSFIMNELFILLIGMSIGVGLNMMMLSQTKHARKWIALIDERIRELLRKLALQIREEENVSIDINETRNLIQNASKRLHEYQNNQLRSDLAYFIQYTSMRISQLNVLEGINDVAQQISAAPQQANTIADFLEEIADSYHEQNQVITLFIRHDEILKRYQASELPVSRKEFEERARLFQILTMVRQFLLLKREFVKNMTSLQRDTYWYKEEIE